MFKIGCAEEMLEVPLFAELFGYGPFQGRRNVGAHDPLFCRVFSFSDGTNRAMIIYTDICTMDDTYARELRAVLSQKFSASPECIALVATHTHSAPALSSSGGIGFGEPHAEFQQIWKHTVMRVANKAFHNEEEIVWAETGKALLTKKLGRNRVEVEKNATDETIRWVRFCRPDGSCKVLLHNHGIHGVSMNLRIRHLLSADWMGAANQKMQEHKLADMPLFLQGPCGDVNPYIQCNELQNYTAAELISSQYISDLEKDLAKGGEKITDLSIRGTLETVRMPVVKQTHEELLQDVELFRKFSEQHARRVQEMAVLAEQGYDLTPMLDFQVIRMGELSFFFIPGEYFVEDGQSLMKHSSSKFCIAAEVANGSGGYFPSESCMKRYPDILSFTDCKNNCSFGFYEIYGYPVCLRFKYQDNISEFVSSQLLRMEKTI